MRCSAEHEDGPVVRANRSVVKRVAGPGVKRCDDADERAAFFFTNIGIIATAGMNVGTLCASREPVTELNVSRTF